MQNNALMYILKKKNAYGTANFTNSNEVKCTAPIDKWYDSDACIGPSVVNCFLFAKNKTIHQHDFIKTLLETILLRTQAIKMIASGSLQNSSQRPCIAVIYGTS